MEKVSKTERFNEVIAQEGTTIAVFKTSWCPDCHFIDPFMPEVVQTYDKATFIEVDAEALQDVASEYNIMGIPSFVAYKNGKETIRFVNKLRKSRTEIEEFVQRAIAVAEALN
ncbi:thioredoxin family protein [Paenibacillus assamensis]|uniref:thioredoxin family protein n=1 Tax=Paenibacillus assamensis TaxID=311244 RepID=UPI00040169C5|nr:thioredoxin family protein [Paenibacillus assamensis]